MRRTMMSVVAFVSVVAGAVAVWLEWSHDRFVDGQSVQRLALTISFVGFGCLAIDDLVRVLQKRRARSA